MKIKIEPKLNHNNYSKLFYFKVTYHLGLSQSFEAGGFIVGLGG